MHFKYKQTKIQISMMFSKHLVALEVIEAIKLVARMCLEQLAVVYTVPLLLSVSRNFRAFCALKVTG